MTHDRMARGSSHCFRVEWTIDDGALWSCPLKNLILIFIAGFWLAPCVASLPPLPKCEKVKWQTVGKKEAKTVWTIKGADAFVFEAGMAIDADGSPRAYHPRNKGLDFNANAKYKGHWTSVVLVGKRPYVQKRKDPAPGYYVSTTSLQDKRKKVHDPNRYVDSEKIPYIVLPGKLLAKGKSANGRARLGDIALVINTANGKQVYAVVADQGPGSKLGEGSIALAKSLGINANPKKGGVGQGIIYMVFPGSGDGRPKTVAQINKLGKKLNRKWGKHILN